MIVPAFMTELDQLVGRMNIKEKLKFLKNLYVQSQWRVVIFWYITDSGKITV